MRRGEHLEDALARWWADRNDGTVAEADVLYVCDRVMATIDRWATLPGSDPIPMEIKTTNLFIGANPEDHWLDQCQAIMACTGEAEMFLVWMDGGQLLYERRIAADFSWQSAIVEGARKFMAFIDLGMVPEGVQLDYDDAGKVYPEASLEATELDTDVASAVAEFRASRANRLEWSQREDRAKAVIATALGSAEVGTFKGEPLIEWRNIKPVRRLDTKALTEAEPELVSAFMVERPQRRLRLLGDKEGNDE
jgi:hypothetical protein